MHHQDSVRVSRCLWATIIVLTCTHEAVGADVPVATQTEPTTDNRFEAEWDVPVLPVYGWIPGVKGDVAVFGQPRAHIDLTPIDILNNLEGFIDVLDGVYFGAGQIRRNRYWVCVGSRAPGRFLHRSDRRRFRQWSPRRRFHRNHGNDDGHLSSLRHSHSVGRCHGGHSRIPRRPERWKSRSDRLG